MCGRGRRVRREKDKFYFLFTLVKPISCYKTLYSFSTGLTVPRDEDPLEILLDSPFLKKKR
jgi:hypothetical protein